MPQLKINKPFLIKHAERNRKHCDCINYQLKLKIELIKNICKWTKFNIYLHQLAKIGSVDMDYAFISDWKMGNHQMRIDFFITISK